jgi:hypothetical protein
MIDVLTSKELSNYINSNLKETIMRKYLISYLIVIMLLTGCSAQNSTDQNKADTTDALNSTYLESSTTNTDQIKVPSSNTNQTKVPGKSTPQASSNATELDPTEGKYKKIQVDGGDRSGRREAMVVVDVGFGDREYWAYTNEFGQLVRVTAKKIILQDDSKEPVTADGRYYADEANVPGTEREDLDQGHVIADSLGGVSNAYNITPQNSTLNRYGDQAYMEKVIRDAGGCTNFEAIITYPNTKTQIPNHYHYTYTIKGNVITDDFDNVNPDEVNNSLNKKTEATQNTTQKATQKTTAKQSTANENLDAVDTNHNGKVSIAEAKAAGYKMPIKKGHWLYKYMDDRDGDGIVGE